MDTAKKNKFDKIRFAIAPMAGITDKAFRRICLGWDADISWSEMVSSEGLVRNPLEKNKSLELAEKFAKSENNYWVQIFGANPRSMAKAAGIIEKEINPLGIDINLGCPVKKAQKSGYGACQMGNMPAVLKIVGEIKKNVRIPLSLKTRLGLNDPEEILGWAPKLEKAGINQLVVHARTLKGMFKDEPDWKAVKKLNKILKIPVIYNGGIKSPQNALFYARKTGCKTLMIGRAAIGRPWIFKEIKEYLNDGKIIKISDADKKKTVLEHAALVCKYYGEEKLITFRTHLSAYLKGTKNASELKLKAVKIKNFSDIENLVGKIRF
ncbi:MAG: tRNA-dihydrouridine synthase family protein [Candidatus Moranbacteria bacterium]|jgi:tRNA-dihydrouridine synthase B|nr:tRNA-dihydrouridine synthase family protein [Candidatus Moranbacteria bacterium]MDD5652366.1 tRNA-dihydrouridine synthase family protein [Candidatus Moranbacteria bacterium]MDX9855284.1 tRNA-dihydrouridine synthase family protein [Candidatus Moranbacteria bacterium]